MTKLKVAAIMAAIALGNVLLPMLIYPQAIPRGPGAIGEVIGAALFVFLLGCLVAAISYGVSRWRATYPNQPSLQLVTAAKVGGFTAMVLTVLSWVGRYGVPVSGYTS